MSTPIGDAYVDYVQQMRQERREHFQAEMRTEGVEPDFEAEPVRCGEWVTCERNPDRHPAVPTCLEPRRVSR